MAKEAHHEITALMQSLGTSVSISMQPGSSERTGILWTVSSGIGTDSYSVGQGADLTEALEALEPVHINRAAA